MKTTTTAKATKTQLNTAALRVKALRAELSECEARGTTVGQLMAKNVKAVLFEAECRLAEMAA